VTRAKYNGQDKSMV